MSSDESAQDNFYPRPPRGGRLYRADAAKLGVAISIHALREEGDFIQTGIQYNAQLISIHALREEGDICVLLLRNVVFNFYPRPPRGGRRVRVGDDLALRQISIHALREEGDLSLIAVVAATAIAFLSTPSARRATERPEVEV